MERISSAVLEDGLRLRLVGAGEAPRPELFLSAGELDKAASFRAEKRRREWTGGRYAAKALIREALAPGASLRDIGIDYDTMGRPVWRDRVRTHLISITHSGPFCAAACAGPSAVFLGIDIEKAEPRAEAWYKDYFTRGELDREPGTLEPAVLATRLWTQKEALLKALGLGLKADPLDIDLSGENPVFLRMAAARYAELGKPRFRLRTLECGPDHSLSLAWQILEGNDGF